MDSEAKRKARVNKKFMDKLKTLTVGIGAKPGGGTGPTPPNCPDCGGKMKLVAVGVVQVKRKRAYFGNN